MESKIIKCTTTDCYRNFDGKCKHVSVIDKTMLCLSEKK